ncbi:MAG: hypothetical protein ACRDBO_07670 [Lachnospiraceae bacterium]
MSLWICRPETVKHPYYMELLGIHLYSSQELSYVIYHHPLLVLDGFTDDNLLSFLRDELNQGFLALKIERWLKSNENPDDVLIMMLQEFDYYTTAEITGYRQQLLALRKLPATEFKKEKADSLFAIHQYGKARQQYQELLVYTGVNESEAAFAGRIWANIGTCYARMFYTEKAFQAYQKAYLKTKDSSMLERMYHLTHLDKTLSLDERDLAQVTPERKEEWDQRLVDAREKAQQSEQMQQLNDLFTKDPIKRQAGMSQLVTKWKREYLAMV